MIEAPTLIVMAKRPQLGKHRLAAEIGAARALETNCALHVHTLREARDPRWRTLLCVAPDAAVDEDVAEWPRDVERMAQGEGDLGARLARVLAGYDNVAVIGTDCPLLTRGLLADAFIALRASPFVLGPTDDGGFWILAARSGAASARAMANVRWSSEHSAADVLRNLGENVALAPRLYDIDTAADLARWRRSGG
jgi:glycosyltransferase A (GT-A) superfamily protein (DUF2064 family)